MGEVIPLESIRASGGLQDLAIYNGPGPSIRAEQFCQRPRGEYHELNRNYIVCQEPEFDTRICERVLLVRPGPGQTQDSKH